MNGSIFSAFCAELSAIKTAQVADEDTPADYLPMQAYVAQRFGVEKRAAWNPSLVNAAEVGGLGVLAAPGVKTLRDPNASAKEKSHAKWETAGLGVLAAHPAYELASAGLKRFHR